MTRKSLYNFVKESCKVISEHNINYLKTNQGRKWKIKVYHKKYKIYESINCIGYFAIIENNTCFLYAITGLVHK
jgi:hypothetical protein